MKLEPSQNILVVGLGLLGGSYALALKKQGYHVAGIARRRETVDYALAHDMIEKGSDTVDPNLVREADLVIFALYPHVLTQWIEEHQSLFKSGAVLTDVTGVKGGVVDRIQSCLREDVEFIAAHPMAGREVCGIENSTEEIFHGANYLVVPTEKNTREAVELCRSLGEILGFSRIAELSVEMHDRMIAFLSQLTHCIAVSLMCCNNTPHLEEYTGDSFRDLTRIANINDEMWSELFLANRHALLPEMERFRKEFDSLYHCIETGDREAIREKMRCSTERRKRFDKREKQA
ncbi:MAG: prephenate dehydrogenase [Clostridia bacterium]|nr:prephenate dehydrogenase [Clostridia bacterium]